MRRLVVLICAAISLPCLGSEQRQQVAADLFKMQGKNSSAGTSWVRLALTGKTDAHNGPHSVMTVQCIAKGATKRTDLFVKFGGVQHILYRPPAGDGADTAPPPPNPTVDLVVSFSGFRPMTLQFEEFPTGQLRYRQPGLETRNLEGVPFLLHWMLAAPLVDISFFKPGTGNVTAEFVTSSLMEQLRTASACEQ